MGGLLEMTLGVMTSVGGFVDVSELVFAAQAGSKFAFSLIWVFVLATVAIIVFGEMSGRVAAVAKQPVFNLMRQRLGLRTGLVVLLASSVVNLITCAAEIGGAALVLNLLTGWPYRVLAVLVAAALLLGVWIMPFKWIERVFGLLGLGMVVFLAAAIASHPSMKAVAIGLVPGMTHGLGSHQLVTYAYFAVAIISAVLFPYETYFYSSGAVEEKWSPKDLGMNRVNCVLGFSLGSCLAIAILVNGAVLFRPLQIDPRMLGTVALQVAVPFGRVGLVIALLGMLFAISGAAVETCLSNAYSLSQYFGWEWGRYQKPAAAPRFTIAWIATFVAAGLIVLSGVQPLDLVEWAVVFSVIVLPFTYLPLILIANDRKYMREHVNGRLSNTLGWAFYGMLVLTAAAAAPLYFMTSGGQA